jgi:hypothetical protein
VNKSKGDNACTVIDFDEDVDENAIREAFTMEGIYSVRFIPKSC